jgi:hypothetical protein
LHPLFAKTFTNFAERHLGVDQTCRSPEYWTLLAPVLEEKYDVTDHMNHPYDRDMRKFIRDDFTWDAFDKLAQNARDGEKALSILSTLPSQRRTCGSSSLESLPTEIINMVMVNSCLDPIDIVSLGLSSQLLWIHVLHFIVQSCRKAPWAETPLLCTGTYTKSLPPAIHTLKPDMAEEDRQFFGRVYRGPRYGPNYGTCPARKFNWGAIDSYTECNEQHTSSAWLQAFLDLSKTSGIPTYSLKTLRRSLEAVIHPNKSKVPISWTLRNHTTKECVSLKAGRTCVATRNYIHVKGMPRLSVDTALLLRICWSTAHVDKEDDLDDVYGANSDQHAHLLLKLKRGKWAGHFFDIVLSNRESQAGEELQGWCDVTSEIIKEAAAWRAVFK